MGLHVAADVADPFFPVDIVYPFLFSWLSLLDSIDIVCLLLALTFEHFLYHWQHEACS